MVIYAKLLSFHHSPPWTSWLLRFFSHLVVIWLGPSSCCMTVFVCQTADGVLHLHRTLLYKDGFMYDSMTGAQIIIAPPPR